MKKHMNIPVFIPHLGCGHSCAFCSQRSVTNVQAAPSPESVAFSIKEYVQSRGDKTAEIAFFGGSFTGIPKEEQRAYLLAAQPFLERGEVESIRVSTRPDYIDSETVAFLKSYGVKTVELGAQSMSDAVLRETARGHTAADTVRAAACIHDGGLKLGLQMMTGLPASSGETEIYTAGEFVRLGADMARIYPTVVFYDTLLYTWMQEGKYTPPSMEESIDRTAAALSVLEKGNVPVIRIGLMETETLGARAAGGAYHPAMGELVRARLWRDRLEHVLAGISDSAVTVFCEDKLISMVVGQKRTNFIYLENKYHIQLKLGHTSCGCFIRQSDGKEISL